MGNDNGMSERHIFDRLQEEALYLVESCRTHAPGDLWSQRMEGRVSKFLTGDGVIDVNTVVNFRRNQVFINEVPSRGSLFPFKWISGVGRSQRQYMRERLGVLKEEGDIALLAKYPIGPIGNPICAEIDGYRFNKRWLNNLRYLSLSIKYLREELKRVEASLLDIGGGYGIYAVLLRGEFPCLKTGIVEFPEQLLLAYYFVQSTFPEARINTLKEAFEAQKIDRGFVDQYDVVLIPIECYEKIERGVFSVVTNFFSLGEMSEEWFETYVNSEVVAGARYFFTINRTWSYPSYDSGLSILSYRLEQYDKLHFQLSNHEQYYYRSKYLVSFERQDYTSPVFEFIGRRGVNMRRDVPRPEVVRDGARRE